MPNRKVNRSAEKTMRGSIKKRTRARIIKGYLRDVMRDIREQDFSADLEKALPKASSVLDKAGKKKTIHPKTASRYRSRLAKHVNKAKAEAV